jgi:hypothetical protein
MERRHEAGFPLLSPKNQKLSHSSTEDVLFTSTVNGMNFTNL